jgi:hypothetical protein
MSFRKLDIGGSTGPAFQGLSHVSAGGNNVIGKKHHACSLCAASRSAYGIRPAAEALDRTRFQAIAVLVKNASGLSANRRKLPRVAADLMTRASQPGFHGSRPPGSSDDGAIVKGLAQRKAEPI